MLFELQNLTYSYSDGTPAVIEVSLSIDQGEQVAILGANGSGKSSLLRLLNGLMFATSGLVRFEGRELTERSLQDTSFRQNFRSRVGFVFQNADAQLFNATVAEEIGFGPMQLGLSPFEIRLRVLDVAKFLGINHLLDRATFRLSGGEKRKVAIASILSMNPDVVLFDEPFLGLDPRSQEWLVGAIQNLQRAGKTTVVATHSLGTLTAIATRAIVLGEDHAVVAQGAVDAILSDAELLASAQLGTGVWR